MKKLVLLSIMIFEIFILGCSSKNISNNFTIDSIGDDGIVIFSVTKNLSKKGEKYLSSGSSEISFYYVNVLNKKRDYISTKPDFSPFPSSSDFEGTKGKLFVLKLKPSDYKFTSWTINTPGFGGERYIQSANKLSIPFHPKRGEILYLGELNLEMIAKENIFGASLIYGADLNIKDSFQRDMNTLKKLYPSIKVEDISKSLFKKEIIPL